MEIIVKGHYTEREKKLAEVKRFEFRRNPYTSGSANLDNMIALQKAVVLCDTHVRKFKPRAAHYELHPAKNMRRVQGRCDICKLLGMATLFLHQSQAVEERRKYESYRRAMEYAQIVPCQ